MKLEIKLPDELVNANPKNVMLPCALELYMIDYEYYTNRNNKQVSKKYIIYPSKSFRNIEHNIVDNLVLLIMSSENKKLLDKSLIHSIVKPFFLEWVKYFNEKFPYRRLNNLKINTISKISELEWILIKNKLILDLSSIFESEIHHSQILHIFSKLEIHESSIEYKTFRGNLKVSNKYIIKYSSNTNIDFNSCIFSELNQCDDTIIDLVSNHYSCMNFNNRFNGNFKKVVSNVKILDTKHLNTITLC